jgi:hypothetical protein
VLAAELVEHKFSVEATVLPVPLLERNNSCVMIRSLPKLSKYSALREYGEGRSD